MDASFFAPLTKDGIDKSNKMTGLLKEHSINKIYSSPFIRTLQTIYPYCKKYNKKINVEYSLSEIQHPHIIPQKAYQITLPEYIASYYNANPKYISILNPIDHIYPENEKNVEKRVKKFIIKLINEMMGTDNNIIIVTHQVVCNIILRIATKKNPNLNIDITFNYNKGGLTKVFDTDKWTFEPINWEYLSK
jgi:broad specificity phosphatase PhoE